ncbi:MAG: efflux RND transporter permease subunit [Bacteroidetes bacterium]|nr:efflux RND transporter permease subunit [Bacteroidota bacterium]
MKKLIITAIKKRWLLMALFLLLAFLGYYSWEQLSIEAYPDIADVTSQVVTQVPGLAAEEVEQQITIPIERALNGLPGMHVMRSRSTFGLSMVTLVFEDGVEDYWSRQRIQERLADLNLPKGAVPGLDPLSSPIGEIYRYTVESSRHDIRRLKDLQDWVIIPRIKQVQGIADVTNFGGITTQYQVEIDPKKLEQYKATLAEVETAINNNNNNVGGSILTRGELGYVVRGIGLLKNLEDLGNIVVKSQKGVPVFLKDLGTLKYGILERKGILGYTDHKKNISESIEGIVLLLKHENPSIVLEGVHKAVDELNNGVLPEGVKIIPYIDRTGLVHTTLNTVSHTLVEGITLVVIVLILFLGNWRGALLVAITIPLALLIAFILMHLTNIPANLLSLGAIDFGVIVDGAIVMMETILKDREENEHTELEESHIANHAFHVARPILFATLIIITAYLPLFAFERVEKKLFTPMAFTVSYALFGALLVAMLLIPGLAYAVYRKPVKLYHNPWLEYLTQLYHRRIKKIMEKPKQVFAPLAGVFLGAVILTASVGKDFLPTLDEGSIWLQVTLPPGISLEKSRSMADSLRKVTLRHEEVTYMVTQLGRNDNGTDCWTPSHYECSVGIKPYDDWPKGKTKTDLIDELASDYAKMPGYTVGFSQPMIDGVMDKIAGAHSELVVKVFGNDFKETRRIAEDVLRTLRSIKGAVDLAIDQEPPLPQLQVKIDREAVARYGLNVSDVADLIEVAIGGKAISQIFIGERVYDITCRFNEESRSTPEAISNLMLTTPDGARIPVSQVAKVELNTGESTITREMNKRHLTVKLNLRGIDLTTFVSEGQQKIEKEVKYDHEKYVIKWGGQFENQNRAYARLSIIVPLALAIMFVLLYSAFGRFRQAGLILLVVPLALFGGMLALNIRGMTLNVSSAVGFIALFGVAIQNGVIMLSNINQLRAGGMELKAAVLEGTRLRFRPILMTATVAILGLLPASLATGIGSDVQRPLATVIVYGLLFATIITLFVLPALYYLVEKRWGNDMIPVEEEAHES